MSEPEWNREQRRWFVDGRPVHADDDMEMQGVEIVGFGDDGEPIIRPAEWFPVWIALRFGGTVLDVLGLFHGRVFCARSMASVIDGIVSSRDCELRWPEEEGARVIRGRFGRG